MTKRKVIVFVAHWVENWNWLLWFFKDLHENPEDHHRWKFLAPFYYLASLFYFFGSKSFDVVDEYDFNSKIKGKTYLIRNFAWQFLLSFKQNLIRGRIVASIKHAQNEGVDVVGLGALTKAEWLTKGGKWIVDQMGEELKIPIVHGDTLTAAVVVKQIMQFKPQSVFITGATSKIGRAVCLYLAEKKIEVKMYTKSYERFMDIKKEAGENFDFLRYSDDLLDGEGCDVWVTGKAIPKDESLINYIPYEAKVINFSVPNPLSAELIRKERSDLNSVEGGLLSYDPVITDLQFTMRLKPGLTYACHAGTMVHAIKGWKHHEVGPVDITLFDEILEAAYDLGFFIDGLKE